jgi:hypothetical protein
MSRRLTLWFRDQYRALAYVWEEADARSLRAAFDAYRWHLKFERSVRFHGKHLWALHRQKKEEAALFTDQTLS